MNEFIPAQLIWWVTAVDVPLITAFVAVTARMRRDTMRDTDALRQALAALRLTVARDYASLNHVKDLESRLIAHLLRIETKLDRTALKAHAVYVNPNPHIHHREEY